MGNMHKVLADRSSKHGRDLGYNNVLLPFFCFVLEWHTHTRDIVNSLIHYGTSIDYALTLIDKTDDKKKVCPFTLILKCFLTPE